MALWHRGVVIITTAQLHSTKPELRFCTGSNLARDKLEICNAEDLWQQSQLEIRLNTFHWSTIPQKQLIIIIYWWTLKNLKISILKKWKKNCWRYHCFHVYQKPQSYEVQSLSYRVRQNFFCATKNNHMMYAYSDMECDRHNFLSFFALLTPILNPKTKIWKKWKKNWRYYSFTHVCHKSRSHGVWFLRYKAYSLTDITSSYSK